MNCIRYRNVFRYVCMLDTQAFLLWQFFYKQIKPCRYSVIIHYAPPALLRVMHSPCHTHVFYPIIPCEFLVTMAEPTGHSLSNLHFKISCKVHTQNIYV